MSRAKCWWHGSAKCEDKALCKRTGNYYPPSGSVGLHKPNRFGSWAEEAHAHRNPGVPWDGIVADLATPEVMKSGWKWAKSSDGRQGPVVTSGNRRELEALCKVAGVRMAEPGEIVKHESRAERAAKMRRSLRSYLERAK